MDDGFVVVSVRRRTSWSTPEKELVRVLHSVNWLGREVSSLKTISECFFSLRCCTRLIERFLHGSYSKAQKFFH